MKKKILLAILTTATCLPLQAQTITQRATAPAQVRGTRMLTQKRYLVHMRTTLTVPPGGLKQVRVWHALPTLTAYVRSQQMPPLLSLSTSPRSGRFELEKDGRSGHIYYEQNSPRPGTKLEFATDYEFFSCGRTFDPSTAVTSWGQYTPADMAGADRMPANSRAVDQVVATLKPGSDPMRYLKGACDWICKNMTYDVNVPYVADDIRSIMQNKSGHCGHFTTALRALCLKGGIPFRTVYGLALDDAQTVASLKMTTDNFPYAHTWAEVKLPETGWVEVDVLHKNDYFSLPASLVQNNSGFQNCSVWITDSTSTRPPNYDYSTRRYECDVNSKISFDQR